MKKCSSGIQHWDLKPQSLNHESSPITTRPGLPPKTTAMFAALIPFARNKKMVSCGFYISVLFKSCSFSIIGFLKQQENCEYCSYFEIHSTPTYFFVALFVLIHYYIFLHMEIVHCRYILFFTRQRDIDNCLPILEAKLRDIQLRTTG